MQRPRDNRRQSVITEVKDTRRNFRNGWEAGKSQTLRGFDDKLHPEED